ncbi:hypothetical protein J4Q44_G00347120 [Coregonus suidteri]|uniref:DDE Tnp4 domain-containing protein n=1 Tax=Coregonus suidteri TaxID=861788 RepID=A0AAN8KVA6_9TELE
MVLMAVCDAKYRPYPVKGSSGLDDTKKIYNYRHSRARRISENCFGFLAARWRILGRALEVAPEKAEIIVEAYLALHNYLCTTDTDNTELSTRYIHPTFVDHSTPTGDLLPGEWRQVVQGDTSFLDPRNMSADRATRVAMDVYNNLKDYFLTPAGQVYFQDAAITRGTLQ